MTLREELKQLGDNAKKDMKQLYEKVKQYPLISLLFIITIFLLIALPHWQVSGINNVTEKVTQENQSRSTLAQVLGGVAIGIGLYYTWRRIGIAEEDLKATKEGQITERFTRAIDQLGSIDQLGNPAIEIRLGGIYALERISNESEKDYWPIMEILTAYIRKNSPFESGDTNIEAHKKRRQLLDIHSFLEYEYQTKMQLEIETIIEIIKKRKYFHGSYREVNRINELKTVHDFNTIKEIKQKIKEPASLNLNRTYLKGANFKNAHLEGVLFEGSFLEEAKFQGTHLQHALLVGSILIYAEFENADLGRALFANSDLEEANFQGAYLEGVDFFRANLRGARNLTFNQLSKVRTLHKAELDEELRIQLKEKYPYLLEPDDC